MALIQNTIKSPKLTVADTDAWLEANKPNGPDKDTQPVSRDSRGFNNAHLFTGNGRKQLPPRKKERKEKPATVAKKQRINDFVSKISDGQFVKSDDYRDIPKSAVFAMVAAAREQCDVFSFSGAGSVTIGWVGRKTFFERFNHE